MKRLEKVIAGYAHYYDEVLKPACEKELQGMRPVSNRLYRRLFVLNGNLNTDPDPERLLKALHQSLSSSDLVIVAVTNSYYQYLFALLRPLFGLSASPQTQRNFLTRRNLELLAQISGLQILGFSPVQRFRWMRGLPVLRWGSRYTLALMRKHSHAIRRPSVSVVVPVRNERGNLETIFSGLAQLRDLPALEVVFVEGGSTDGTWDRLQELARGFQPFRVQLHQQSGRGKADAVRLGFLKSHNELLMILDGDLSVQTADLNKFYQAYTEDSADLLIGTRLLFPFERGAMRPLNFLGNLFFAKFVNHFFRLGLSDLLCGTKVIARTDYDRIRRWQNRHRFADPFGDFELIFGAATIGLRIGEVPVHYRARTYGQTNIRRFRDGFRLLKMTLQAALLRG